MQYRTKGEPPTIAEGGFLIRCGVTPEEVSEATWEPERWAVRPAYLIGYTKP